jgi:hypothetical protein
MDMLPAPPRLDPRGENGFNHATSEHIYNFVNMRTNMRENYISALKDVDPNVDTHNRSRVAWETTRREMQKPILRATTTDGLIDRNETGVLLGSVAHFARADGYY